MCPSLTTFLLATPLLYHPIPLSVLPRIDLALALGQPPFWPHETQDSRYQLPVRAQTYANHSRFEGVDCIYRERYMSHQRGYLSPRRVVCLIRIPAPRTAIMDPSLRYLRLNRRVSPSLLLSKFANRLPRHPSPCLSHLPREDGWCQSPGFGWVLLFCSSSSAVFCC